MDSSHWYSTYYPKQYNVRKVQGPISINGDVHKPVWQQCKWSDTFVDIIGSTKSVPSNCSTKMKMCYDKNYLYIAAILTTETPNNTGITKVTANFTKRNSPIFHTDSDFEVFVDVAKSCHDYKEFEANAINTVWNLCLV